MSTAKDRLLRALEASTPGEARRPPRLTRTALARLRVDALRGAAEALGADARGTKDALVERLMRLVQQEEATAARPSSQAFKPG